MLGDTGVAVNPDDERYTGLVGKMVILPLMNREIPVFADSYVDSSFGTGLVKVTPAHDPNDFDAGQLAAWLHGKAADYVLENEKGPIGMNPSELPSAIRHCLNQLIGDLH